MRSENLVIKEAFNSPWKAWNQLHSWLTYPIVRFQFAINGIPWGKGWRFYGAPIVQKHRRSVMKFGNGLQLRSSVRSTPLGPYHPVILSTLNEGALLKIGDNFGMNGGVICAAEKILIGNNVTVGANTTIVDTEFHPSNPDQRRLTPNIGQASATIIQDDVFVGANCFILRGVTIGRGSLVGTGSVVTSDVAPGMIVFGNPARTVGKVNT